jgi:hypothetical protein
MRALRRSSIFVLITGIAIATWIDSVPERSAIRAGEHGILSGDFHVHAFPGDGALLPWTLRREAAVAGIDVFALTNHNQIFTAAAGRRLAGGAGGPVMIVGAEITNPRYHLIAVGISRAIDWRQPASAVIADVHAQGGVAIAAHPTRTYWDGWPDDAVAMLDGVEVAHPYGDIAPSAARDFDAFHQRARRLNPTIATIGSSDFHASPSLGRCRTYLFTREPNEAGVLDAIRAGRTVAEDGEGHLYGDPDLVRAVQAARPAGRSDEHRWWRRLALGSTWAALLAMLLFRGEGRGARGEGGLRH